MRHVAMLIVASSLLASPAQGAYEFYVKVKGVDRNAPSGPIYLKVETTRDDDGDGTLDEGVLRLTCVGNQVRSASFHYNVKSPRDAASGMASGKQSNSGVRFVKEWGASTPQFFQTPFRPRIAIKADPKSAVSAGWLPVTISEAPGLCAAAAATLAVGAKQDQSHDVHELEKIGRKKSD